MEPHDPFDPLEYTAAVLTLRGFEIPFAWVEEVARYVGIAAEMAIMLSAEPQSSYDE